MSKCIYCRARKGKRGCPALGGLICSQCCGESRVSRIACPSDCIYLEANSDYQHRRAGEHFAHPRREFYQTLFELGGDPAARLFNMVEMVTFGYFHHRRDSKDAEAIAGVQALRRALSPLHLSEGPQPVFSEHLRQQYDAFAKAQSFKDVQLAMDVLDRAIEFVSTLSGSGLQPQRFLSGLIGYFRTYHPEIAEQLSAQANRGQRIVLPGDLPGEPSALSLPLHRQAR